MKNAGTKKLVCAVCLILIGSGSAWGYTKTFEASFNGTADLTVGNAAGTLLGNSTVVNGKLLCPAGGGGGVKYAVPATNFFNIVDNTTWGSNTVVWVGSCDAVLGAREAAMCVTPFAYGGYVYSAAYGFDFWINMQGQRPMFQLYEYWGSNGLCSLLAGSYDPCITANTMYFIACSWRDNGNGTVDMTIYVREANDTAGTTAKFYSDYSDFTGKPQNWSDSIITIGNRVNGLDFYNEQPGGVGIDLVQVYGGTYTSSLEEYNALFDYVTTAPVPVSVTGTIVPGAFSDNKTLVGVTLDFVPVEGGAPATKKAFLNENGTFTVTGIIQGVYNVTVKAPFLLPFVKANETIAGEPYNLGTITLVGGDLDGDHHVTSTDLAILLQNLE